MKENAITQEPYTEPSLSRFGKGYLIYLGVILGLVLAVLIFLWIKLSSYQEGIDNPAVSGTQTTSDTAAGASVNPAAVSSIESERAAQQCFTDYVDALTIEDWIRIYRDSHPDSADSDEDITAFINASVLPAKSSKLRAADYDLSSPKYLICTDENVVASFVLEGSGENWQIKECRILATGATSLTIEAPKGCELRINGADITGNIDDSTLGESGIIRFEEATTLDGYEEDLVNPVIMCEYVIDNLIGENPTIEVPNSFLSLDGKYYSTTEDTDGLINRADSFVKAMLNCYAQGKNNIDGNLGNALSYVDSSSPAAKIIRDTKSGLEWTPPDSSISLKTQSHDLCVLADNCRFVEVTCASGSTYRVYFIDTGNGYKIVQFAVL